MQKMRVKRECHECFSLFLFKFLERTKDKMQKLSLDILEKMMAANLSKNEVNILLYIARFQDDFGKIQGVHYKEICEELNISFQGFYDVLRSLEKKEIIRCEKKNYYDKDITICDNNFVGKENYGRGYVSLYCGMLRSKEFAELKAGPKLMALWLMREWRIHKKKAKTDSYKIGKEKFIKKFEKLMGITARTARAYLGELKPFMDIYLENGKNYFLTFKGSAWRDLSDIDIRAKSENKELREHIARTAHRRNRMKETFQEIKDSLIELLTQYNTDENIRHGAFDLSKIVARSIEIINKNVRNKYKWKRRYNAALVHKELRRALGLEVNDEVQADGELQLA